MFSLTALDLSFAYIGVAGAKTLAGRLQADGRLTSLNLSHNEVSDAGVDARL